MGRGRGVGFASAPETPQRNAERDPEREVRERAELECHRVEIPTLGGDNSLGRAGSRPWEKLGETQSKRQPERRDDGQGPDRCFQRPADGEAPGTAGQLVDHHIYERPERDAENKEPAKEPRLEKSRHVQSPREHRYEGGDAADHERSAAEARVGKIGDHRGLCSSASLASAGRSASLAFRLNCSARMYATIARRSSGGTLAPKEYIAP